MIDAQVPTDNGHQDHPATGFPQLAQFSPVSQPLAEQDAQSVQAATSLNNDEREDNEETAIDVGSSIVSAHPTYAEAEKQNDVLVPSFDCPHCDKSYTSSKSLKRHINDKKSVCIRARETVNNTGRWACPRCQAQMSKRFSVERHIKESCWKICDQCCESDSFHCDAYNKDGDCTTCKEAGKSCTKHAETVQDCVAAPLTSTSAEPNNALRRIRTATLATYQKREKRKAAQSPGSSPQSKPKPKRKTKSNTKGQTAFQATAAVKDEGQHDERVDQHTDLTQQDTSSNYCSPPASTLQSPQDHVGTLGPKLLPSLGASCQYHQYSASGQHQDRPTRLTGFHNTVSGHHASRMLPPISDRGSYSPQTGTQYAQSMQEMIQRQVQAVQNMGLAPQYASRYGHGIYPAPVVSSSRSSLNIGHDTRGAPQLRGTGQLDARESPLGNSQIRQTRSAHCLDGALPGTSKSNSDNLSHQSSIADQQPSADQPRVPSRQHSFDDIQLLAPESRVPSRQPSRQSSVEALRLPIDSAPSDHPDTDPQFVIKLPLPRELLQKLSLTPTGPAPTSMSNPILQIRIHSNTYDLHGLPIFSILRLRLHDIFGPRLAYYCAQRGARYGVDWKFIYRYPAPTPENPQRQKYFDITYNMKPVHAQDREYPEHAMRNGDTVYVVGRRADMPASGDDVGEQIECQRIAIQNGETPIYQDKSVNDRWYKDVDHQLSVVRNQLSNMRNAVLQARQLRATHETRIAELEAVNTVLRGEVEALRRPYQRSQQQAYMSQDEVAYRQYLPQQQELPPGHTPPSGYIQERPDYAPGSMAEYLHSRGYRVPMLERREGPVRGAGDRVAPEEEEDE